MAFNKQMHPRNPYKHPPDFKRLAAKYSAFRQHCTLTSNGKVEVDFRNDSAVRALTCALLKEDFSLDVQLPPGTLVPRLPQRLNYLLWIEDQLKNNGIDSGIVGIDIGTGASCVYALLGARLKGWRFIATDADKVAIQSAKENVDRNELGEHVAIVMVGEQDGAVIKDVVHSCPDVSFTFCMCNPPFFEADETSEKFLSTPEGMRNHAGLEVVGRSAPKSATIARINELAVEGGEVSFISRLIDDSVVLQKAVRLYTTMLGKKSSVTALKRKLERTIGVRYAVDTLSQGHTQRWVLAWTYDENIRLPCSSNPFFFPSPGPSSSAIQWISSQLEQLGMQVRLLADNSLHVEARSKTWVKTRRKNEKEGRALGKEAKRARPSWSHVSIQASFGVGDGRDSLTNAGNFDEFVVHEEVERTRTVAIQAFFPVKLESFFLSFTVSPVANGVNFSIGDGSKQDLNHVLQYLRNQNNR